MAKKRRITLDLDRGVRTRFHKSGLSVSMYKDDPGTYLTETGEVLDVKFAKEAGFDVEADLRKKIKGQRLEAFQRQLEDEMRSEEDALAQAMSDNGNVDVRHVGAGQYAIFDKSGKRLTRVAMTRADVELLVGPVSTDPNDPIGEEPASEDVTVPPAADLASANLIGSISG